MKKKEHACIDGRQIVLLTKEYKSTDTTESNELFNKIKGKKIK